MSSVDNLKLPAKVRGKSGLGMRGEIEGNIHTVIYKFNTQKVSRAS